MPAYYFQNEADKPKPEPLSESAHVADWRTNIHFVAILSLKEKATVLTQALIDAGWTPSEIFADNGPIDECLHAEARWFSVSPKKAGARLTDGRIVKHKRG